MALIELDIKEMNNMQIETKELEYCKLHVNYVADADVVVEKHNEALLQLKEARIPGYRKGRASKTALKQYVAKNKNVKIQLDNWVKQELATKAYDEIQFDLKIKTIGQPEVIALELGDKSFTCEMNIMKKPEFTLKDYKGMEIPKPPQQFTTSELAEKMMQDLRKKYGEIEPYGDKDFVQAEDQITLDFEITVDNKIIEGGKQEGQLYSVGSESVFPEFDANILGMSAGETREFDLVLPDNFKEQAGKQAHIKVTVHMGTKTTLAPLDDELAKKVDLANYGELRTKIEAIAGQKNQSIEMAQLSQQVIKRLVNDNDFEVPGWLSSMEGQFIASQQGLKWEELKDEQRDNFIKSARDNVKLSLILDTIQSEEPDSQLSDPEAINILKTRLQEMGQDVNQFFVEGQKNGQIASIIAGLKSEYTVQFIIRQAKILD